MTEREKDRIDCLFSDEERKLANVKFFRGDRDVISQEEFETQVHRACVQKRLAPSIRSNKPPHSGLEPVDVRAFVAKL